MSNHIAKKPIKIPSNFKLTISSFSSHHSLFISSSSKSFHFSFPLYFSLSFSAPYLHIVSSNNSPEAMAEWGSLRSKINTIIIGISEGFTRKLILKGVGYRFQPTELANVFLLFIGFTSPITITIPTSIECKLLNNTTLIGKSDDLLLLTNTFNKIRLFKPSDKDKYKGKGILITS